MTNSRMGELLGEMSVLLELDGANPFRVRAYQRAGQVVTGHPAPLSGVPVEKLTEIPGIGKGIAAHVAEMEVSGTFQELEEMRKKFPPGLLAMLKVQGLGPKRAKTLFDTLKIDSLDKLKAAAQEGRLRGLPGFGEKTEANILEGVAFAATASERVLHWAARQAALEVCAAFTRKTGLKDVCPAGSLRRGKETVGDLDFLCSAKAGTSAVEAFIKLPQVSKVLSSGSTKASVILEAGIQADFRVVPPESWGAALVYFTGSKDHGVALREHALRLGYSVNEYGVFRASDKERRKPLAGRTEEEVYARLGLSWIPPELRENRGELEAAAKGKLPKLVELSDIRGDFHNHSKHSDGEASLLEMAQAAKDLGWEWVGLGDHSRSVTVAHGLDEARLKATLKELAAAAKKVTGIRLMRSMEVDILKDGSMDYPDEVLSELDVVIGAVHSAFKMDEPSMTERVLKAVRHPKVHIIAHPSGRLLSGRGGYKLDTEAVMREAARCGTALEINGQPDRQDITDVQARRAKELGAAVALNTDAHAPGEFCYMEMAVTVARRAWLTKDDVLNCRTAKQVEAWLRS
ncbi:MAG: DNA polymerase/3'-5' exonuclease PolX [Elusimicrobia bacterium]|nr:DNA polymerase/3'-5' exonuclease PolX [Elusimicrobiota bacterium]